MFWGHPFLRHEFGWPAALGTVIGLILLVLLVLLIVWAVRRGNRVGTSPARYDALSIAKERYARGEVSQSEFEEIKKNLS